MKFTEGKFKEWGYELAERDYGDKVYTWAQYDRTAEEHGIAAASAEQQQALDAGKILIKDVIADAMLQQILLRPAEYEVIANIKLKR